MLTHTHVNIPTSPGFFGGIVSAEPAIRLRRAADLLDQLALGRHCPVWEGPMDWRPWHFSLGIQVLIPPSRYPQELVSPAPSSYPQTWGVLAPICWGEFPSLRVASGSGYPFCGDFEWHLALRDHPFKGLGYFRQFLGPLLGYHYILEDYTPAWLLGNTDGIRRVLGLH